MTHETEQATLQIFLERAERVLRSRLVQQVLSQHLQCKMEWKAGEGMTIDYPDLRNMPNILARSSIEIQYRMFASSKLILIRSFLP